VPPLYRSLEAACMLTLRVRALTVQGRGRGPHLMTDGKLSEEMLAGLREVLGACGEVGIAGVPTDSDIAREEQRLAGEVRVLGANGLQQLRNED
jgi:hypothetical protein